MSKTRIEDPLSEGRYGQKTTQLNKNSKIKNNI